MKVLYVLTVIIVIFFPGNDSNSLKVTNVTFVRDKEIQLSKYFLDIINQCQANFKQNYRITALSFRPILCIYNINYIDLISSINETRNTMLNDPETTFYQ